MTIILVFMAAFFSLLDRTVARAKKEMMRIQLSGLRGALHLYKALHEEYPQDLRALVNATYEISSSDKVLFGKEYLSTVGSDAQGHPVDPFGRRFYYDRREGVVRSVSKGYEEW